MNNNRQIYVQGSEKVAKKCSGSRSPRTCPAPLQQLSKIALVTIAVLTFASACQRSDSTQSRSSRPKPTPLSDFERALEYVRQGRFARTLALSRADNGVFTAEDKLHIRQNTPTETNVNMIVVSDDQRHVIIGTNFDIKPENMDALRKRFTIEDYTGR